MLVILLKKEKWKAVPNPICLLQLLCESKHYPMINCLHRISICHVLEDGITYDSFRCIGNTFSYNEILPPTIIQVLSFQFYCGNTP